MRRARRVQRVVDLADARRYATLGALDELQRELDAQRLLARVYAEEDGGGGGDDADADAHASATGPQLAVLCLSRDALRARGSSALWASLGAVTPVELARFNVAQASEFAAVLEGASGGASDA